MKKWMIVLLLGCVGLVTDSVLAGEGLKVLFIGNSFTYQGPIPDIFQAIAVDAGKAKARGEAGGGGR